MKKSAIGMRTALATAMVMAVGLAAFPGCDKKKPATPPAPKTTTPPAGEAPKAPDAPKPPG